MIQEKNYPIEDESKIKSINLKNSIILDTETTGLGNQDEICEITVIDAETAQPLINTLIKPKHSIPEEVIKIHGISNDMVADAPDYSSIHPYLETLFKEKKVIIYNASFDLRMLQQSALKYNLIPLNFHSVICAMKWYAEYYGQWNDLRGSFKWQSLCNAAKQQNLDIHDLTAHRALDDCKITQRLIKTVNEKLLNNRITGFTP